MLDLAQIRSITLGAVDVYEQDGFYGFNRFTKNQRDKLDLRNYQFHKTATTGMRMEFTTKGGEISFDFEGFRGCNSHTLGITVLADGTPCYNVHVEQLPTTGTVSCRIPESGIPTHVGIYFPNMAGIRIRNVNLPEDFAPVVKKRKLLALGDSITQGFKAIFEHHTYVNILADAVDAEVVNQGLGGDVFYPDNLDPELPFAPDLITVAYGVNDWTQNILFTDRSQRYLERLTEIYPETPIVMLLPIWCVGDLGIHDGHTLPEVRAFLREVASRFPTVRVVDTVDFVPHLREYYLPDGVHPNDLGFLYYGTRLAEYFKTNRILE